MSTVCLHVSAVQTDVWPHVILKTLLGAVFIIYFLLLGAFLALYFLTKNVYILVTDIQTRKILLQLHLHHCLILYFFWNLELPWWC